MNLQEVEQILQQIQNLQSQEEDESKPYEHKYAAADILKDEYEQTNSGVAKAVYQAKRGLVLLETDLLADGEACVTAALAVLEEAVAAGTHQHNLDSKHEALQSVVVAVSSTAVVRAGSAQEPGQGTATDSGFAAGAAVGTDAGGAVDASRSQPTEPDNTDNATAAPAASAATNETVEAEAEAKTPSTSLEALLQECYNALGVLFSGRGDWDKSLAWLEKALKMYEGVRAELKTLDSVPSTTPTTSHPPAVAGAHADTAAAVPTPSPQPDLRPAAAVVGHALRARLQALEAGYTTTLFYLAQVMGHMGRRDRSALYCAATLQRQLASGDYRLSDWVQNCLQLSTYYNSVNAFALAQYCLAAASALAEQHRSKEEGQVLDPDVCANLELYLCRLLTSYAVAASGEDPDLPYPSLDCFPDLLGLRESATVTAGSLPSHMAVEHCVHEACGLDVLPATIAKFVNGGDAETAALLEGIIGA